jgi:hypothetical protein
MKVCVFREDVVPKETWTRFHLVLARLASLLVKGVAPLSSFVTSKERRPSDTSQICSASR